LPLTAVSFSTPAHGTLTPDANGDGGFTYTPIAGFYGNDNFTYEASDGVATSAPATVMITVSPLPPTAVNASYSVAENQTLTVSAPGVLSGDTDSNSLPLTAELVSGPTHGTLSFDANGDGGFSYAPSAGVVGTDSFTYLVADGVASSSPATVTITIEPAAPMITAPAGQVLDENSSQGFSASKGNSITLGDPAAPAGLFESLALRVTHGTLRFGSTTGLSFAVAPNGSAGFTITGTLANLNAALNTLVYTPAPGFAGTDSISLLLKDQSDGLTDSVNVALTVIPLPKIVAPAGASLNENASLHFSLVNGDPITLFDAESPLEATESLTLQVSNGTLMLPSTTGLVFGSTPNGSSRFTAMGTLADLNTALDDLAYTPNANYAGADKLSLSLSDSSDGLTGKATVAIVVNAPPSILGPSGASLVENGSLAFSSSNGNAITLSDAAAASGAFDSLTLRVSHGTLRFGSTSGIIFAVAPNGSAGFTIMGTLANISIALNTLVYTPNPGYVGSDTLVLSLNDPRDRLTGSANVRLTVVPGLSVSENFEADLGNEAIQWAGLTAAMEIFNA
jgi:hypothetical protein